MSRRPKKINQHYFDTESKAMWYVLGAFFRCYSTAGDNRIMFKSSSRDLVEIVKQQMESEHAIISDNRENDSSRSSHWIQVNNRPYLCSKLGEYGLNMAKEKRRFPFKSLGLRLFGGKVRTFDDSKEQYISHFVRGYIEPAGIHAYDDSQMNDITLPNSWAFTPDLHMVLAKYAGVERELSEGPNLIYHHQDSLRIHDFIYQDWAFIQEHGLYLPDRKDLFFSDNRDHGATRVRRERVTQAMTLLRQGIHPAEVANRVGYSSHQVLSRAFRQVTGQTVQQYQRSMSN